MIERYRPLVSPVLRVMIAAVAVMLAARASAVERLKVIDASAGRPPSDAVVIFDGAHTDALVGRDGSPCRWPVRDGALVAQRDGGLWTKLHFQDAQIHAEFATPVDGRKGPEAGNSGLYLHGLFEMQILNSYQNPMPPKAAVGSVYGMFAPQVNAARPPGAWQTYDVIYTAPRRDAEGTVTRSGAITALLNGVLVQNHVEFRQRVSRFAPLYYHSNPYVDKLRESLLKTGSGPLHLQDHGSPVRFRNIWIRPLDDNWTPGAKSS